MTDILLSDSSNKHAVYNPAAKKRKKGEMPAPPALSIRSQKRAAHVKENTDPDSDYRAIENILSAHKTKSQAK